jgi:hypothetical protein
MISREQLDIRLHAAQRMLERNVSVTDVLAVLNGGETIEDYPDDTPFPSRLILGWVGQRPVHVVSATSTTGRTVIITVYEPSPEEWDNTFHGRRT